MERPTMKENLNGYSLEEAHKLYTDCPELYRYIVKLDEYIDELEDNLNKLLIPGVVEELIISEIRHKHQKQVDDEIEAFLSGNVTDCRLRGFFSEPYVKE